MRRPIVGGAADKRCRYRRHHSSLEYCCFFFWGGAGIRPNRMVSAASTVLSCMKKLRNAQTATTRVCIDSTIFAAAVSVLVSMHTVELHLMFAALYQAVVRKNGHMRVRTGLKEHASMHGLHTDEIWRQLPRTRLAC